MLMSATVLRRRVCRGISRPGRADPLVLIPENRGSIIRIRTETEFVPIQVDPGIRVVPLVELQGDP